MGSQQSTHRIKFPNHSNLLEIAKARIPQIFLVCSVTLALLSVSISLAGNTEGSQYAKGAISILIVSVISHIITVLSSSARIGAMLALSIVATIEVIKGHRACGRACELPTSIENLPLLALGIVGLIILITWISKNINLRTNQSVTGATTALIVMQLIGFVSLNFYLPRLCPKCIALASLTYMLLYLKADLNSIEQKQERKIAFLATCLFMVTVFAGFRAPLGGTQQIPLLTNKTSNDVLTILGLGSDNVSPESEYLILLTLSGYDACKQAKALLDEQGVRYQVVSLNDIPEEYRRYLTGSAPQLIYLKDGYTDTHLVGFNAGDYRKLIKR